MHTLWVFLRKSYGHSEKSRKASRRSGIWTESEREGSMTLSQNILGEAIQAEGAKPGCWSLPVSLWIPGMEAAGRCLCSSGCKRETDQRELSGRYRQGCPCG